MPSVNDVIESVDLLRVHAIGLVDERCSAIRNRNSTCRRCEEACIASAIEVGHNEVRIDAAACVNCGVCVPVCPNNALYALEPTRSDTLQKVFERAPKAKAAIIACARIASKRIADDELFTEVPCLGHIGEEDLIAIAGNRIDDIVLVDGDCSTCKYGAASPSIDGCVETASTFWDALGVEAMVTRTSDFPPEVKVEQGNLRGEHRRALLSSMGDYAKAVMGNVAQKTLDEKLGTAAKPKTLYERLRAGKNGKMPTFTPQANYDLLENGERALAETRGSIEEARVACAHNDGTLDIRHFGSMGIDASACSGCGLCVLFCPTEACVYSTVVEPPNEEERYIEFNAMACTQCRLCEDVCIRKCLTIDSEVEVFKLYDFEPSLIAIPKPKNKTSLLDLSRRK